MLEQGLSIIMKKLIGGVLFLLASSSYAINIIVPFSPGGPADLAGRAIQQSLSEELRQQVVLEHKPGASGEIAAAWVAKQTSGTFLLVGSASLASSNVEKNSLYDLQKDLIPVAYLGKFPIVLVARKKFPFQTLDELKSAPADYPITYGSAGNQTSSHLNGESFKKITNTNLIHVPYKGSGQSINDLLAGNIDMAFIGWPSVSQYVKAGQLIVLGTTSTRRLSALPDVPTFAEKGFARFGFDTWIVLLSNKSADPAKIKNVQRILQRDLADPKKSQAYINLGLEYSVTEIFSGQKVIDREIKKYQQFYIQNPSITQN
jgi:tripartite-type tricarboxylate transporter receptor subunit TctC